MNERIDDWGCVVNFAPDRAVAPGDVGYYDEERGRFVAVAEPAGGGGARNYSVCERTVVALPRANFTLPEEGLYFATGDVKHVEYVSKLPVRPGEVYRAERFLFGPGEALLLYGANNVIDRLYGALLPRWRVQRWADSQPGLAVVVRCIRSGPLVLLAKSGSVFTTTTLHLQTHIRNGRSESMDLRPADRLREHFDLCCTYQPNASSTLDAMTPLLTLMPIADFLRTYFN